MALTDGNESGMVMPVAPMYGGGNNGNNNGWGGDWAWIILLLLLGWGNNGNGFGGGFGGFGGNAQLGYDFPWLMNGQQTIMANTNNGFRDQMINDGITSIRDGIGNLSTQLCNCCGDMQMALANGFAGVEQGANARQMANMQTAFAAQQAMSQGFNQLGSQFADCCCENRLGLADLKYTVATENCADRTAAYQNTRDIIDSQTRGTQAVLDKLCQLELDGIKAQVDAKNDRISELQTQLNMANLAASQTRQTTDIQNSIINELRSCPIPAQPVYGSQPIFTCPNNNNNGCGCGCGNNF